jgi:hypothetical protein
MWQEWPAQGARRSEARPRARQQDRISHQPHVRSGTQINRGSRGAPPALARAVSEGFRRPGGQEWVRKEEEQQYSHCGQKAKDDHCITPKQKSLATQSRECLRKEEIRSTGTTLSSNTGPQVATERGPRAPAERQRDKTTTAGHGDASTYARCRWPQSRLESQRRAARRRPPRWSGTCRVWRRACLARHRLDAA